MLSAPENQRSLFDEVLIDNAYRYAEAEDADVTLKLYNLFKDRIIKEKNVFKFMKLVNSFS